MKKRNWFQKRPAPPQKTETKPAAPQKAERRQPEAFDFAPLFRSAASDPIWQDRIFHDGGSGWSAESDYFVAEENRNRCYVRYYEYRCHNSHGTDVDEYLTYSKEETLREGLEQYADRLQPEHVTALRAAADAVDAAETACRACLLRFYPASEFRKLLSLSARSCVFQMIHPIYRDCVLKVSTCLREQRHEAELLRKHLQSAERPDRIMPVLDWKCIDPASGDEVVFLTILPLAKTCLECREEDPDLSYRPQYRASLDDPGPLCESESCLSESRVESLGVQMADALRGLHRLGFAHLDVKPENFFVLPDDAGEPRWSLGDLDSARELRCAHTGRRSMTRLFMPPERGGDPCAADVYAWGVSMGLLALHCGVFRTQPEEILKKIREHAQYRLQRAGRESDVRFYQAILRAVDPDPARRFRNGAELYAALTE